MDGVDPSRRGSISMRGSRCFEDQEVGVAALHNSPRACARGPASVLTAPPGPPRSSRRTWCCCSPDEHVSRLFQGERYKCDRVYDETLVNTTVKMS